MGILSFLPFKNTWQIILIVLLVAGLGYKYWSMSSEIDSLNEQIVALEKKHKEEVQAFQMEVAQANLQAEAEKANTLLLEKGIAEANMLVSKITKEKDQVIKDFEKYKKTKPLIVEKFVHTINTTATASCNDFKNFNIELSKVSYKDLK